MGDAVKARVLLIVASTALAPFAHAQLEVVYDSGNTVSVTSLYKKLGRSDTFQSIEPPDTHTKLEINRRLTDFATSRTLPVLYPLMPTGLSLAEPRQKQVVGLTYPLFVIGIDPVSLGWLETHFKALRKIGAQGVIVQARSERDVQRLTQRVAAAGVVLQVAPASAVADGYQISTYPMLLRPQRQ